MFLLSACRRELYLYACLLLLLQPLNASADQQQAESLVDIAHQKISTRLENYSRWFDNFFSDPRSDEEVAGTLLRLRGSTIITEGESIQFDGKLKALLNLPNLERRFHLILSSEDDNARDETLKDARINQELAENTTDTSLALQYTQQSSSKFSLTHRLGFNLENGFNPQLRSRVRYSLPIASQSLLTLTQAVFWENHDGFGEESRVDYDYSFNQNMLLRATGQGLFSEVSQGYEWLTMLQWLTSFSASQALSVGAYTVGETSPQNQITEYNMFLKYRQRFIKKWLFIELQPEIYWLREKDFKATTAFTLSLEVQFGK